MDTDLLLVLGRRVARGAKLLDKKLGPTWRRTMRAHRELFDLRNSDCCILGTLEHYNGRMKALNTQAGKCIHNFSAYDSAASRLSLEDSESRVAYGFTQPRNPDFATSMHGWAILQALWQVELDR